MTRPALRPARRAGPFARGLLPLLLAALGACAAEEPLAPLPSGGRLATAEPARGAGTGPVTSFDGRYTGTVSLNPDRSRVCRPAPTGEVELVVTQGRARFLFDPALRQTLSGTVGRDGSIRMSDIVDSSIATSGVFTENAFIGEHRNGRCSYAVTLRRQG